MIAPAPTESGRPFRPADFATFAEALDYAASGACGFTFYTARGEVAETLTFARLREDAGRVAASFRALGLARGDRVAILAETNGEFARAFCGAMAAGLCPAPMPLPVAFGARAAYNEQILRIATVAGARAVVASTEFEDWIKEATRPLDLLFCGRLDAMPDAGGEGAAVSPAAAGDLAYLQFSSGTTGAPKGVAVTHEAMMANLHAISAHGLKLTSADRGVSWLPLYHDMGLVGCFLAPIASQFSADLFATKDFVRRPLLWPELFSRNRATITYAPSFGYDLAVRRARGKAPEGMDLSTWRVAGIGGDMIKAPTLRAFAETFGPA
ncbi:MAG: AMP-binding protein, partial [Pseudomonadota bacterium]